MTFAITVVSKSMKPAQALFAFGLLVLSGCAQMRATPEADDRDSQMEQAAEAYSACVTREAERSMQNPLGAEDIAIAAHGRCWTEWDAYRDATRTTFFRGARSPGEIQLATDKTEAHLRQFERDTRSDLVNHIVQQTLSRKKAP